MPQEVVLAVDLGTGGPKVALVATDGTLVGAEHETVGLRLIPGGGAEQSPDDWWRAITTATQRLLARLRPAHGAIVAVSATAQWMGTVAVDEGGQPIAEALIWMDARGAPHAERLTGGGLEVPGTGYNARRLWRWLQVTGGLPSRTGKDPVGHLAWLRHERPDVYRRAQWFLDVPDYLNLRLTGLARATPDTAVGYWCTDNRDLGRVAYVDELVAWAGLDRSRLPELVPTGSVLGPLRPEAAAELGIPPGVPVVTATGDTSSAAIGAGAVRDFDAHLYVGTSSWLSCPVPFKKTDVRRNITSLPSGIPGRYWVATEQDVAGEALDWLVERVLVERVLPDSDGAHERVLGLAAQAPPGSGGVLFAPWLNGERTPVDDQHLRGTWFNLSLSTGRAELARAVLEGVALNTRWMLDAVEQFVRRDRPGGVGTIRLVGGGARSALWCQVMADVLDRPVAQVADPVLANVRGAGLAAAVALGRLGWDDIPGRVRLAATFDPDPTHRRLHDDRYADFRELHRRTRRLFARLNGGRRSSSSLDRA